jgi:hypothetical protein
MLQNPLYAPILVQLSLTGLIYFWLGYNRIKARVQRTVVLPSARHLPATYPPKAHQAADCLRNQFEMPVLFYVTILVAIMVGVTSTALLVAAWVFVICRIAHALIHMSYNKVPHRFYVWCIGLIAWATMLIIVALHYWQ